MDLLATMLLILFFTIFFFIIIKTLHQALSTKGKTLPPGPKPLPLIGSLHLLGEQPHKSLAKLAETHGPIMLLRLGFTNTVVISSKETAKEVMQKHDLSFSSRSIPDAVRAHNHHKYSVVWLPVAYKWRALRRFMYSNIFSQARLDASQHSRARKVRDLVAYCEKCSKSGEAVDVGRAAFTTSLNLLSNTIFSRDCADPFVDSDNGFKELVANMSVDAGKPNMVDFFPILKRIDPQGIRARMASHFERTIELIGGLIDERLGDGKSENVDVINLLLVMNKESPEEIDRTQIERICMDLFLAGTDTTSNTLEWAMAETLRNPKVLKKAKEELEQVIGKGKTLNEGDISRLPYLTCIVKETLRLHPPVPLIIRRVEDDVEVCGYTIPKNCQVLVNCWAIGRDRNTWKDPLEFEPERFSDSETDLRGRDFEFIPFGAGRRVCPGLSLAVRTVPVMLGSLLNSFDWRFVDVEMNPNELDMEEKFGITLQKDKPLRVVPITC